MMALWEIAFIVALASAAALALWQALQAAKEGAGGFDND
jgi:hypothetical protein